MYLFPPDDDDTPPETRGRVEGEKECLCRHERVRLFSDYPDFHWDSPELFDDDHDHVIPRGPSAYQVFLKNMKGLRERYEAKRVRLLRQRPLGKWTKKELVQEVEMLRARLQEIYERGG